MRMRVMKTSLPGQGTQPILACRQRGTVLVVAMILLLVLTLLGVTALNTTTVEERMAANAQDQARAFQVAETGLVNAFFGDVPLAGPLQGQTDALSMSASGQVRSQADYETEFVARVPVPPCPAENLAACWNTEEGSGFVANMFETRSDGLSNPTATGNSASATLQGGFLQISK